MNKNKAIMKNHLLAGLDITSSVTLVIQGGRPGQELGTATVTIRKEGTCWAARDEDGKCVQSGGAGAKFIIIY